MKKIHIKISKYYSDKIKKYGAVPQGLDWNSNHSMLIRFEKLSKILDLKKKLSLTRIFHDNRDPNTTRQNTLYLVQIQFGLFDGKMKLVPYFLCDKCRSCCNNFFCFRRQ